MKAVHLAKAYNPKDFEDPIYELWEQSGDFAPADAEGDPFVIVIPPPNVTGVLHMGHGLNNTLQDILIRYYRMTGRPTLWLPGTDHAGIATQNVVDRMLRARGINRHDLGRERFIEETWKVKEHHQQIIIRQLKKIGSSCDWSRERFTLDEGLSRAVREVFVSLYEKGMIYKGNYLVNWCASCGTALSDDEVEYREVHGGLYRIRYFLTDGSGFTEIATTRPETMLGDVAVAVHPEDPRYAHLVGKEVELPLCGRSIPVIADSYVDMEFGTGMLKITPAHDPNDREVGRRHGLEDWNILNADGTLNERVPGKYRGMEVREARKAVVNDLTEQGYLQDMKDHDHQVGHCYRCDTAIEPFLSDQWFVRMKPMADMALEAWEQDKVRFYPKRWENTYAHWLRNIKDWCISRQLWWGHRIPVWHCESCGEMTVSRTDITLCDSCGSKAVVQEEDVLDTWFSSWLWPFSTLGWPEQTEDLERFFPTTTLVTGYDIIFFWVARMIMASLEFMGEVPFRDIYITGLVRDITGKKMSKSSGNGIDPLDVVDAYGADAMKFTLCFMAAQGQDIPVNMDSFKLGSRFCNKIWNAVRFILMNLEGARILPLETVALTGIDRWVYHQLNEASAQVKQSMENYRFNDASQAVYEFFWNDFCDWYLEASKPDLYAEGERKNRSVTLILDLLAKSLKLLHPFVSFITEELYQKLPNTSGSIITAPYPEYQESRRDDENAAHFAKLQELVRGIRSLKSEFAIPPETQVRAAVHIAEGFASGAFLAASKEMIRIFVHASQLDIGTEVPDLDGSVPVSGIGYEAYVYVRESMDVQKELAKLTKEHAQLEKQLAQVSKKLTNEQFLANAPEEIIRKEQGKKREFAERLEKVSRYLQQLQRM